MFDQIRANRTRELFAKEKFEKADITGNIWIPNHVPLHLQPYMGYLKRLLKEHGEATSPRRPIFLCFSKHSHKLPRKSLRIVVQPEQTITSSSESDQIFAQSKTIDPANGKPYFVRILGDFDGFAEADFIFEYSATNLAHVLNSDLAPLYRDRAIYIPPLIGFPDHERTIRSAPTISTMFGGPGVGRRADMLAEMHKRGIHSTNIFNKIDYKKAFQDVAIMLNYRQFSSFHTLEELRVLPSLVQGCIVVTEDAPLLTNVPYSEFLEVATELQFVDKVQHVAEHYEEVWGRVFGKNSELISVFGDMYSKSASKIRQIVSP